jgi:hypothetical protein
MDQSIFEQGETPQTFLESMKEPRSKFEQHLEESRLSADQLNALDRLPKDLNVMVIAEDWSGDVLYFLPPLLRMAEEAGWKVRIFRRDRYPELILPYRKESLYHSIPVFVFFDREFNEVARWIERPAAATRMIDEESLKLRRRLREEHKEAWRQETMREIFDLVRISVE